MSRSEYLVVDTSAFIKNAQLQELSDNIISIPEVVKEVTSKRQLRRLVVLPYDLQIKEADPDSVKFVTEFSKKTGDYPSLSSTDIKVIALTYELHKQHVGADSIHTEPISRQISYINHSVLTDKEVLAGFYTPKDKSSKSRTNSTCLGEEDNSKVDHIEDNSKDDHSENEEHEGGKGAFEECCLDNEDVEAEQEVSEEYFSADEETETQKSHQDSSNNNPADNTVEDELEDRTAEVLQKIVDNNEEGEEDEENEEEGDSGNEEEEDEDDGGGEWITPSNLKHAQRKLDAVLFEEKPLVVSCVTTDFAMQNVLKQMGLNVVALDGRLIRQLRTFILRCYACFKTTSIMTKQFCPKCGHKTLKRVAVSVDEEGRQRIHINLKRPLTGRGKKFSLPTFQGGKHANNPILFEDQPVPDQRPTRLGRMKTNALDDDYIAGMSPFAVHDINSKSAMLGIRTNRCNAELKYWMDKNPNAAKRRAKK
uniref:RNA-binding protein NOB1 n=1 Tax=Cacopsylla melanoneura TaxID=428564 RepID=A0A8D8VIB0_9HEMI